MLVSVGVGLLTTSIDFGNCLLSDSGLSCDHQRTYADVICLLSAL